MVLAARREGALERVVGEIRQRGGIDVPVARYLLDTGDNVKLGPQILVRTMRNRIAG